MNQEEMDFMQQQQNQMNAMRAQAEMGQVNQAYQTMDTQEREKSLFKDQLDLGDEIDRIKHLLQGDVIRKTEYGNTEWSPAEDPEMIILSEYGIHLIMNTICFYINKNTLLSNYDEDTINRKMEDFATDLTDTIFMEYEKVFQYPTFEQCKEVFLQRIEKKKDLRKFTLELLGQKTDSDEIRKEFIDEMEGRIEREISNIREQIIKNKLKRFLILIREVQDAIHSTYLRAFGGQERRTLRQHIHVSESRGQNMPPKNPSSMNPLNWGKTR